MKLKAATLIEALIAMVIVLVCLGIASMIYVNVISSGNQRTRLNAHLALSDVSIVSKKSRLFLDEEIRSGNIIIRKTISPYKESPGVSVLVLVAVNAEGKVISTWKELVFTSE